MTTEQVSIDVAVIEQVRELVGTEHVTSFIEAAVLPAIAKRGEEPRDLTEVR